MIHFVTLLYLAAAAALRFLAKDTPFPGVPILLLAKLELLRVLEELAIVASYHKQQTRNSSRRSAAKTCAKIKFLTVAKLNVVKVVSNRP